jgi:hypothetical protein
MGSSLGKPSSVECVTDMTPSPGTVHAIYRQNLERVCQKTISMYPFVTIPVKGRTLTLLSIFNQLKKYGGITDPKSTFENVDIYFMVEILKDKPIFIKVVGASNRNRKNPLPSLKENGWNIIFVKGDNTNNNSSYIQEINLTVLFKAINSDKLKIDQILPDTRTKLSVLYETNIANREATGYCTTVVRDTICPDMNFDEFLKNLGIVKYE